MDDFLDDYILFDFIYSQSEGVYQCPVCEVGILEQVDSQIQLPTTRPRDFIAWE